MSCRALCARTITIDWRLRAFEWGEGPGPQARDDGVGARVRVGAPCVRRRIKCVRPVTSVQSVAGR